MSKSIDWELVLTRGAEDGRHPWDWVEDVDQEGRKYRFKAPRGLFQSEWWRQRKAPKPASRGGLSYKGTSARSHLDGKSVARSTPKTAIPDTLELFRQGLQQYAVISWPELDKEVDEEVQRAAKRMVTAAARELGVSPPTVQWIADYRSPAWYKALASGQSTVVVGPMSCSGFYDPQQPNCVYLKLGLTAYDAAAIAAHETRHRWQHKTMGRDRMAVASAYCEQDATEFQERMMREVNGE